MTMEMKLVPTAELQRIADLLAEREYGSTARSPAHNARLLVENLLAAAPTAPAQEPVAFRHVHPLYAANAPRVKALEWTLRDIWASASSGTSSYDLRQFAGGSWFIYRNGVEIGEANDRDGAVAFADADYERRAERAWWMRLAPLDGGPPQPRRSRGSDAFLLYRLFILGILRRSRHRVWDHDL